MVSDKSVAVDAWEALFRAQVSVMRQLGTEFPVGPLTLTEYDVLFTLSTQPDRRLRLRELNEQVLLTQPSVSRLIDRLATRGLIVKIPAPGDGRGIIVALTEEGFNVFRRVAARHMESIAAHLGCALSVAELRELTQLCDKLRRETIRSSSKKRPLGDTSASQ